MGLLWGGWFNFGGYFFFCVVGGGGWGGGGGGCATFLSNCFACGYFFVLLFLKRRNTYVSLSPRMVRFSRIIVVGVCMVGIPSSIQNLLNVTGMTVLNNFTSGFGADAVAAMGIAHKVNMVPMQVAMGFSQGIMPLISYNYGSGNAKRMKDVFFFAAQISLGMITVISVGYYQIGRAHV